MEKNNGNFNKIQIISFLLKNKKRRNSLVDWKQKTRKSLEQVR